ncbi:MAG: alanine racemase [Clostridia bacterium]
MELKEIKRTYVEINLDNIAHNINVLKKKLYDTTGIMAVVKANCYGHGATVVSTFVQPLVSMFAVSNIIEAVNLRKAGIIKPILILGYTPSEYVETLSEYSIIQTIYDYDYGKEMNEAAISCGVRLEAHFKVDTGMTRIGFNACDADSFNKMMELYYCEGIYFTGIFTHFAVADSHKKEDEAYTKMQLERFSNIVKTLKERGAMFNYVHCCNSAAAMKYREYHFDMVRYGISMYGLTPDNSESCELPLKEAMTLKTVVTMVKRVKAGTKVSYGCTFTALKDTTLVTVAMGYADGYPRTMSNKGIMYINGKPLKIAGRVCMDQIILETDETDIKRGDEVSVFGYGTNQSISSFSAQAGTINYETVCLITPRVQRRYILDGKIVAIIDSTPQ